MNTDEMNGHWQKANETWQKVKVVLISAPLTLTLCHLPFAICRAADPQAPRLFFSDAKISFTFPNRWRLDPSFPFGPLFTKSTQQGPDAVISCRVSDPLNTDHLASDVSYEFLKQFADQEFAARKSGYRILSASQRTLAGQHCYEVTWEDHQSVPTTSQSEFFFVENRVYALTLSASTENFLWLVPDYQGWLSTVQLLSRQNSGALMTPANGGLWVHQTGGARIRIPESWLIGVSDDRTLGAAFAKEEMHGEFTASLETLASLPKDMTDADRLAMRRAIEKKGFRVTRESEEPFHGYPAFHLAYEGTIESRFVKGEDVWISSPKARWLLNMEADGRLFRDLAEDYRTILNNIQFF